MRTEHRLTVFTLADGSTITTRSALETRWAIFFKELGLNWEYEPCTLKFRGGRYTPDFFVKELGFVEIKPTLNLLISESSTRIEKAARNFPDAPIYAFCGERVSFGIVAKYQGKSIFAPTWQQILRILSSETEFAEFRQYSAHVEVCMNRANRAKLDHFASIGKILELESKKIVPTDMNFKQQLIS